MPSPSGRVVLGDAEGREVRVAGKCGPPPPTHTLRMAHSPCSRKDVLVVTPWLAPIIWEGTFNIDILNEQFRLQNTTIGLTVFAIKK
jgi:hypothetical protein